MRKFRPVAILLSIQFIIAVSLALINPITDYVVRKYGTEYTFATKEAYLTGDFSEYVAIISKLKYDFNESEYEDVQAEYAIIDTAENSLAYISDVSNTKPKEKNYINMDGFAIGAVAYYTSDEIKLDSISPEARKIITDVFFEDKFNSFFDGHEVTVSISVYKGRAVANTFYVDGIESEEYFRNMKG